MPPKAQPSPSKQKLARDRRARSGAKKAVSAFSGELAEPISVDHRFGWLNPEFEITQKTATKLELLSAQLGVDPKDPARWWKSFCLLAFAVVPGMAVVFKESPPPPKRRDKFWDDDRYRALVSAIDAICAKHKKYKIHSAVMDLIAQQPSVWGRYKGRETTLIQSYKKGKRGIFRQELMRGVPRKQSPLAAVRSKSTNS